MPGDIKGKYLASVTLADTGLNSLAASSTRLAGYETNAVDVGGISGGPPADILLSGVFKAAAANGQAGQIDVWVLRLDRMEPAIEAIFSAPFETEPENDTVML
ncbi:MAG: hypothetical protein RL268_2769 [Pseudomonadota bacterium]